MNNEIESSENEKEPSKLKMGISGLKAAGALVKGKSVKEALAASVHTMENVVAATPPTVLNNLNTSAVVNLMPTDQDLSNEAYQNMGPPKTFLGIQTNISAENWKTITWNDKDKIKTVVQELGVDGVLVIDVRCSWGLHTGLGKTGVAEGRVVLMAVMFTADGKKIWPSSKSRSSDKTTGIIAGV